MLMTSCAYPHIKAGDGIATTAIAVDAEKFTSSVSDSIENLSYIAVEAAMTTKSAKHKTNNSITKTTSSTTLIQAQRPLCRVLAKISELSPATFTTLQLIKNIII